MYYPKRASKLQLNAILGIWVCGTNFYILFSGRVLQQVRISNHQKSSIEGYDLDLRLWRNVYFKIGKIEIASSMHIHGSLRNFAFLEDYLWKIRHWLDLIILWRGIKIKWTDNVELSLRYQKTGYTKVTETSGSDQYCRTMFSLEKMILITTQTSNWTY